MHHFSSEGVRIAFIDIAPGGASAVDGAAIVLVHGFASTHAINWVNTLWVKTLTGAGRRVVALDNRGHGESQKLYDPAAYHSAIMADDVRRLLDHLGVERADVMGYSMGARIAAHLALHRPERVRSLLLGGLGIRLVEGEGLPEGVAEAMEAPSIEAVTDPGARGFRAFAEQCGGDLKALAACIRGSRQTLSHGQVASIDRPTLITVGAEDGIAGSAPELASLMPQAEALVIPDRDHNTAVGDRTHKARVLAFLAAVSERPEPARA
jgi:pimeloyl-ACP methyl ester carboxylesterase